MLSRAIKRIVFVCLWSFPIHPSVSLPTSFDKPFCQRALVFSYFCYIRSLWWIITPVSRFTTVFNRYHGTGPSSICLSISCVVIIIVGAVCLASSCVTSVTTHGATLVGVQGFRSSVTVTLRSGACFWYCLVGNRCVTGSLTCFVPDSHLWVWLQRPLFLSVIFLFPSFGMIFKVYAWLRNDVWCVSFNIANVVAGTGFCNALIKYRAMSVAASAEEIIGISTLFGEIQRCWKCARILFML